MASFLLTCSKRSVDGNRSEKEMLMKSGKLFEFKSPISVGKHQVNKPQTHTQTSIGFPGLVVNLYNVYLFSTRKSLRTPYGYLTLSRCIANSYVLLTFICYVAPTEIVNHIVGSSSFASLVGNLTGAPCISIIAVQTFLAVHRLLAAFRPISYQKTFGFTTLTMVQLCFSWLWGAGVVTFWEVAPRQYNCSYVFDVASISWIDNCPPIFLTATITIPVYTSSGLVIAINILILCKLLALNNRLGFATKTDRKRSERHIKRMAIQASDLSYHTCLI
ncbi:hypothetical protein ANCCAN_10688 [Ancylostoma caninum]|uniref:7TM GPCR serpentine receptor class x (Srx) domain-containing protein n=1 Tax=Ancylostoma caninum TaxID=29170 RepID=A0A368GG06_ANCCA|nr:hypothetical protein ANCCAN_10688 [Ancylostoma caninum]